MNGTEVCRGIFFFFLFLVSTASDVQDALLYFLLFLLMD